MFRTYVDLLPCRNTGKRKSETLENIVVDMKMQTLAAMHTRAAMPPYMNGAHPYRNATVAFDIEAVEQIFL